MEFRVLGPVEALDDGHKLRVAAGKQRALLAALLLNANRSVPVTQLVDDLWGEHVPETAVKALQVYVSKLRKALPAGRLQTRGPGYMLTVADAELDLERVERLAADGRSALAAGEPASARDALGDALAQWRGPALAELDEPFARAESSRLEELRLALLEDRIEADLALGRHAQLVSELEALCTAHPLRERLRGQWMLALYRAGRQAEALEAYQSFRRMLADDLGIEPSLELREIERRILQQDPELMPLRAPPPPQAPAARSPRTPVGLVGRDDELGHLDDVYRAAGEGERRVVFVSGEPGAGKTTLVNAFLDRLDTDVPVARGQCVESRGAGEAYMPVLEALARLGRTDAAERLVPLLRERAPTWLAQLPWLVPEDERANDDTKVTGFTRERMLREIVEVLEAFTADRPAVLVLEDLHWSDYSTLDLVDVVARRFEPARLLVLGTYRPAEARAESHPLAALVQALRPRNLASELAVGSLSEESARAFLAVRLDGADLGVELAHLLHTRTRGNPLFMEKLVDAWVEDGAIVREDGAWRVALELGQLASGVPETVRSLIEQRLAALSSDAHRLLEGASVAGAEFASAIAAAAAGVGEDEAEELLHGVAADASFIAARGDEEWPDGTVSTRYGFTHDLCYETLRQEIPPGRLTRLHRLIAERLESAYGERTGEIAPKLAWHFLEGREPRQAVRHLREAAARSLELSAPREALVHLTAAREALAAIQDDVERTRLELGVQQLLGPALIALEGWSSPDGEAALTRARALARAAADPPQLASTLHGLATMFEVRGEYERSEELLAEALALPAVDEVPQAAVDANELMACSLYHQGSFQRSLEHAERALASHDGTYASRFTAAFGEHPEVSCQLWAALSTWFLGLPDQAIERAERAVAASTLGLRARARAAAQAQASVVAHLRGDTAAALAWSEAAMEAGALLGFAYWRAMATVVNGWARAVEGDFDGGIAAIRDGIALSRGLGARMDDAFYLALLADAAARSGRTAEALSALDEARAVAGAGARPFFFSSELERLRGELIDGPDGERHLREALETAERLESPSLRLRAAVSLARRTAHADDVARVVDTLHLFREGRGSADLVAAQALLDELGVSGVPAEPSPVHAPRRPPVRYAQSGELSIAYQVTGADGPDLVLVPGFVSHLEKDWEEPRHAAFLDRLGSFSRLIRFDKRGTGLSDRPEGLPDLELRMDDLRAVQDAAGSTDAILFGYSEGGPLSILYTATHPGRVRALVLFGAFVKRSDPDDDYPWAPTAEERARYIDRLMGEWGFESDMKIMCPSADDAMARWWGERSRAAASPGAVRALMAMNSSIDVRDALPAVHVPTLVVHRGTDFDVSPEEGRYIADRIVGARYVEIPGRDHFVAIDPDQILDVVEPFVREHAGEPVPEPSSDDRVLATVMVTDIVDSTPTVARLGDRRWAELLERHHHVVRSLLARHRGEEIDVAGDGFLALFDGPARAIRCGRAIARELGTLGLPVRVGVHTGEIERAGSAARGIAIHLTARIATAALPGEVLVSATTRDLVTGSGLTFADRGMHTLKGIDEPRRLFAVAG